MASPNRWPSPICVDGRMLGVKATGVGSYAETLVRTLDGAGAAPLILETRRAKPSRLRRWVGALRIRPRLATFDLDQTRLHAGSELFREAQVFFNLYGRLMPVETDAPAGVMHWTYPVPLRLVGWRNVYTIHDAIPLTHSDLTPIDPRRHRRLLIRVAAEADRMLTVSMAARSEIIEALGCPAAQVTCVPQGVNPPSLAGALPEGLAPKGFFLFCGAIEPRKNLTRLVDAHAASGSLRPLVIAGPAGWRSSEILQQIESRANVIRLPYQDRGALDALIRGARALLFPSLAEGFGIPIVEAMMAATAVLTTSRGAPAEIAGGAALGVDPEDSDAMSLAIRELDQDDALVARLSVAGLKRAEAFALPAYASRLMDFYASLVGWRP